MQSLFIVKGDHLSLVSVRDVGLFRVLVYDMSTYPYSD